MGPLAFLIFSASPLELTCLSARSRSHAAAVLLSLRPFAEPASVSVVTWVGARLPARAEDVTVRQSPLYFWLERTTVGASQR